MTRPLLLAWLVAAAAGSAAAQIVGVEDALPGVRFDKPLQVATAPTASGDADVYYVVEQGDGAASPQLPPRILTVAPGATEPSVFLDLSDRVAALGGETGLLGLAFHPGYAANGRLFVHYTAPASPSVPDQRVLVTTISEFARDTSDPLAADPASERVLLRADQPATNHNGGSVDFGPDGFLYIALGDGGGGGDPYKNGQDPTTLLGAVLRIDVDDVPDGAEYGIPDDNPFAQTDGPERDEIFAYGLRNPFKLDASEWGVWTGDVGQGRWEEVDRLEAGGNYGWNEVEGPECFRSGCDLDAFEAPVTSYFHDAEGGSSITGGYVTTGADVALPNHYVYGDFVSGRIWAVDVATEEVEVILEPGDFGTPALNISSIDPDPFTGDVLVTDYASGAIYRLVRGSTPVEDGPETGGLALAGPNPFGERTAVRLAASGPVRVALVDVQGREVAVLWDGPAPGGPLSVDGADLAPGVYAVVATGARGTETLRLVKAR